MVKIVSEFDERARGWDANPVHMKRSVAIAGKLIEMIPVTKDMRAMEYGAGTAILSMLLADGFKEIVLIDSSGEMVKVMSEKISASGMGNLKPIRLDLEKEGWGDGKFDCIYSQMVFHHVSDVNVILRKFHELLNPGGYIAVADLYPEDGSFHGDGFTGHKGFDVALLKSDLERAGFSDPKVQECYVMNRETGGSVKEYPLFLMVARKNPLKQG